jgi:hypothetical protein
LDPNRYTDINELTPIRQLNEVRYEMSDFWDNFVL